MKKYFKEYRIELSAALIALVGIFLLVNRGQFREQLLPLFMNIWTSLVSLIGNIEPRVISVLSQFSITDLAGVVLVLLSAAFIGWRVRFRFLRSERWLSHDCPRCGNPSHRVHRTSFDRFLGAFLLPHSRRYQCTNESCQWSGLRNHEHSPHRHAEDSHISTF